jgi:hypothetical protein
MDLWLVWCVREKVCVSVCMREREFVYVCVACRNVRRMDLWLVVGVSE